MGMCRSCSGVITKDDVCVYVRDRVFHAECYANLIDPSPLKFPDTPGTGKDPDNAIIASYVLLVGYRKDEVLDITPQDYRK